MLEKYRDYCQFEYNSLKNVKDRNYDWFELDINKDISIQRIKGAGECLYFLDNGIDESKVEEIYYEYIEKIRTL